MTTPDSCRRRDIRRPMVRGLPLITAAGARRCFARALRRTSGKGISRRQVVAPIRWSSFDYDDAQAYCHWLSEATIERPCACRRKLNGKKQRVAAPRGFDTRGATISIARVGIFSATHPHANQRGTRPTGTSRAERAWVCMMCGNVWSGSPTGTVRTITVSARRATREARSPGTCASFEADRGLNDDPADAAVRVSSQGAARHLFLQRWIQDRVRTHDNNHFLPDARRLCRRRGAI